MDVDVGILDGGTDAGAGGHVAHPARTLVLEQREHELLVTDVAAVHGQASRVVRGAHLAETAEVVLLDADVVIVVHLVDDHDGITPGEQVHRHRRADEARAATKKACELLAYTYHHLYRLNVTGLRFFTVYGPRGRPDMAPFKFIDRVSRGLELQQFGDGSSSRDYTYIDDIVDGIVRAIDRPYPYQVFNLGKGSGTSLKEFISIVEKHVGRDAKVKVLPDQPGDVPYTCADVSKAYDLLGYSAAVPFDEGIRRTVRWYEDEYVKNICIEPETQANGMGRAASFAEIRSIVRA